MTRLPAAPGMALRGRWCCRCRRGNFRVTPFPVALGCARSQAAGLGRASASREEAGWETLAAGRGSAGERAGTSARPGSSAASQGFETLASGTERGGRGKVLLCGVKWRLSCRGAGARSLGASPGIIQAPGSAFLSVKPM